MAFSIWVPPSVGKYFFLMGFDHKTVRKLYLKLRASFTFKEVLNVKVYTYYLKALTDPRADIFAVWWAILIGRLKRFSLLRVRQSAIFRHDILQSMSLRNCATSIVNHSRVISKSGIVISIKAEMLIFFASRPSPQAQRKEG